jgi:hypothetical protein
MSILIYDFFLDSGEVALPELEYMHLLGCPTSNSNRSIVISNCNHDTRIIF